MVQLKAMAAERIINMPAAFSPKLININCQLLTLLRPIMLIPTSSGRGEAIITAPKIGIIQVKYGV